MVGSWQRKQDFAESSWEIQGQHYLSFIQEPVMQENLILLFKGVSLKYNNTIVLYRQVG